MDAATSKGYTGMTLRNGPSGLRARIQSLLGRKPSAAARMVASIERSPTVLALDGPFTHDHVHTRGVRLHVATAGDPTDPLILLIHGAFGGWFDFRDVIAPLAEQGFHVAAVDLRGYGMSDKPPSGYGARYAAGDINGVIGALGHDDAILVGPGAGGSIAWTTATSYPQRVRGVITVGSVHPTDTRRAMTARPWWFVSDIARNLLFRLPPALLQVFPNLLASYARREILRDTSPSYQRSSHCQDSIRLRRTALGIDGTFAPVVRTTRIPTGAVPSKWQNLRATAPALFLRGQSRRFDHLASQARARTTGSLSVIYIPGVGPLPHIEAPLDFVDQIAGFARGL